MDKWNVVLYFVWYNYSSNKMDLVIAVKYTLPLIEKFLLFDTKKI